LSARLHGHFSNRGIWVVSQMIMAAGLVLPALHSNMATIVIAGLCVGGTFMIVTMAGMKEAHRIAPADDVMRHIGVMTAAFATGQMVGPVFAGALHNLTGGFGVSLGVTSVLLVATALALTVDPARKEATAS
jgi:MFS family permease